MIGQKLGSYRVLEQIGVGRMATIYKAYDPDANHYVAIKVLSEPCSRDLLTRTCFLHGAEAAAHLKHPHILPVFAFGDEGIVIYMSMPYLPAGTLKDRLRRDGLSLLEAAAILTRLAGALDYAHTCGVLHGDVRPSNILFDEDGSVYLSDFATAAIAGISLETVASGSPGMPAYMSPELCKGDKSFCPASDQYSLGIVAYEMLIGHPPFQAGVIADLIRMHLSDPVTPPRRLRPDLPESAQKAILRALEKQPGDRWPACSHFAGALSHAFF